MADPGFPRGGGTNSPEEAQTYDFAIFSQKLHEIERIWAWRRASLTPPLDPPLFHIGIFSCHMYLLHETQLLSYTCIP